MIKKFTAKAERGDQTRIDRGPPQKCTAAMMTRPCPSNPPPVVEEEEGKVKRSLFVALVLLFCALPCQGAGYRIEILQVGNVDAFDMAVTAAKAELAKNGLIEGQNLSINRTVIDADLDAGIWEKAKIFLKIKNQAARIASAKPDLVITVGTPATPAV